tara:strand:+ start:10925 stop:11539 length:615 start_codon:yes stop_codon:yes gene_type:complete
MSFRIEEKLYIKSEHILDFKEYLNKLSGKQLYKPRVIKSLYFDNLNLDMYNDSIEGIVPRKKIRIREYPDADDKNFYLEIKHSSVEGRFKTRKIINNKNVNFYKKSGFFDIKYGICLPNFYVSYEREYSVIDDIRISLDRNLTYKSFKSNNTYNDQNCIVEIKTSIKKNLDDLTKIFPFQRIRFSKYCFAVDNLNKTGNQRINN